MVVNRHGFHRRAPVNDRMVVHRLGTARNRSWWLASAAVLVGLAMFLNLILTSPNMRWDVVGRYFTSPLILKGLERTIELTVISMVIGILLGLLLAFMRLSPVPVLSYTSWLYIWFFRGTPLFIQIIFWYNLASLLPQLAFGVPFGPHGGNMSVNHVVTPFFAAILSLSLNEGAYMAEICRSGVSAVSQKQVESALGLGLTRLQAMLRIVLPQAVRIILPPSGNQVISMLKNTSLVAVTSLPELLYSAELIYNQNFQTIPLLVVASLWYLIVTSVLYVGQYYLERRFSRGVAPNRNKRSNVPVDTLPGDNVREATI